MPPTPPFPPNTVNQYNQPLGYNLPADYKPPPHPTFVVMQGRHVRLEPFVVDKHGPQIYASFASCPDDTIFTYLPYGPFRSYEQFRAWAVTVEDKADPMFWAMLVPPSKSGAKSAEGLPKEADNDVGAWIALGVCAYLRINTPLAMIEVGWLTYGPGLQGTIASTEAMILMMRNAFALGYRRYEWKCNTLNAPSKAAARRLGMGFEGVQKAHMMVKGQNRDTAWFAVTIHQWEELDAVFTAWLDDSNFDAEGKQRQRLSDMTRPIYEIGSTVREIEGW